MNNPGNLTVTTPTITPFVDELVLSPMPQDQVNNGLKATPVLMISPSAAPEPSLDIYKGDNSLNITLTPTPGTKDESSFFSGDLFPMVLIIVCLLIFIIGIVYALSISKNSKK